MMKIFKSALTLSIAATCGISGALALTDSESASVLFMKQEEKLSRDVYNHLAAIYDVAVFANIASAEQRHMNSVDYLIQSNGLLDTTPAEVGVFTYPELTDLYSQLTEKGELSLLDALEAGVLIEETDIADLEVELTTASDVTLITVYSNLLRGSYNHLKAFNNCISTGGTVCESPNLQMQNNANGQMILNATGGNINCPNGSATNLTIQTRAAGGTGPWRNSGGNANGAARNAGSAAAQMQLAIDPPSITTLFRARGNVGSQAIYSNELCSDLVNTPWPDGVFLGQGWYATWMGNLHIANYPLVYSERHGWITIESFINGELWFVDANGHRWMSTEERYPWVYDPETGTWI